MITLIRLNQEQKGILFNLISVAFISLSPVLHKLGMVNLSPLHAATLWCLFSALFTCLVIKVKDIKVSIQICNKLFVMALMASAGVLSLFYALFLVDPSTVAFANRSNAIFVVLLGVWLLKEGITRARLGVVLVNFVGLLLFSYQGIDIAHYQGILWAVLSAFLFAYANMKAKVMLEGLSPTVVNFYSQFFSFLILACVTWFFGSDPFVLSESICFIILSAFTAGFLGMFFYYKGISFYTYSMTGVVRAFSPVFTMLYSLPFFDFSFTVINLIGLLLILISSLQLVYVTRA